MENVNSKFLQHVLEEHELEKIPQLIKDKLNSYLSGVFIALFKHIFAEKRLLYSRQTRKELLSQMVEKSETHLKSALKKLDERSRELQHLKAENAKLSETLCCEKAKFENEKLLRSCDLQKLEKLKNHLSKLQMQLGQLEFEKKELSSKIEKFKNENDSLRCRELNWRKWGKNLIESNNKIFTGMKREKVKLSEELAVAQTTFCLLNKRLCVLKTDLLQKDDLNVKLSQELLKKDTQLENLIIKERQLRKIGRRYRDLYKTVALKGTAVGPRVESHKRPRVNEGEEASKHPKRLHSDRPNDHRWVIRTRDCEVGVERLLPTSSQGDEVVIVPSGEDHGH